MSIGATSKYPSKAWVRRALRRGLIANYYGIVLDCFIIGSEARGEATDESDLDVAVIIPGRKNVRSVTVTERYYARFDGRAPGSDPDLFRCRWNGRIIDFQFFYPGEADEFPRIELAERLTRGGPKMAGRGQRRPDLKVDFEVGEGAGEE